MTRWPRPRRRGVGVWPLCVSVTCTGRSGSADRAGGIRDIRGTRERPGCFLIFEAADRVMDVPAAPSAEN